MSWRLNRQNIVGCWMLVVLGIASAHGLKFFSPTFLFQIALLLPGYILRSPFDPTLWKDAIITMLGVLWMARQNGNFVAVFTPALSLFTLRPLLITATLLTASGVGLLLWKKISTSRNITTLNRKILCPYILPSRTTHSRFFPQRHSFSYSYLQVAIPVGFEGRCGGLLSIEVDEKKAWFHVQASDYLERGLEEKGLKSKLGAFLESKSIKADEWDHAWLITAPRFLGYAFNPVSFWYVYDKDSHLTMMLLEVNNTFDERRIYFLKEDHLNTQDSTTNETSNGTSKPFKNIWEKDFHVSPFNSRKGHYSLSAIDPFGAGSRKPPVFDNTIVLSSSKNHVKLVARVFSDGTAIDPRTTSGADIIHLIACWCWVGFLTAPRIIKEAFVLFFRRGLHVWLRPEIMPTSIGRRATPMEISLEHFFRMYLAQVVKLSGLPIKVIYKPGLDVSPTHIYSSEGVEVSTEIETLEIRVLTPAFFSRFVHYAHTAEAFDRESIFTDERNRTIWVSRPDLLARLLSTEKNQAISQMRPIEKLRWVILQRLRCQPSSPAYLFPQQGSRLEDIRRLPASPLDHFVQASCEDAWLYRRLCIRLFLAQRFTFGFVELIDFSDLLFRVGLAYLLCTSLHGGAILTLSGRKSGSENRKSLLLGTMLNLIRMNVIHLWACVKGCR